MSRTDLGACLWCGRPADRLLTLQTRSPRVNVKGQLVNQLPRQVPACPEHARQLYRHNAERVGALYRQAAEIAGAEQLRLC